MRSWDVSLHWKGYIHLQIHFSRTSGSSLSPGCLLAAQSVTSRINLAIYHTGNKDLVPTVIYITATAKRPNSETVLLFQTLKTLNLSNKEGTLNTLFTFYRWRPNEQHILENVWLNQKLDNQLVPAPCYWPVKFPWAASSSGELLSVSVQDIGGWMVQGDPVKTVLFIIRHRHLILLKQSKGMASSSVCQKIT